MEPQTPEVTLPPAQSIPPAEPPKPKNNSFIIILLSVSLLLATSLAFFFALQTQKLTKQLANIQIGEVLPPTPTVTPTPEATQSADKLESKISSVSKTYHSSNYKYSFQYPSNLKVFKDNPHDDLLDSVNIVIDYKDSQFRGEVSTVYISTYDAKDLSLTDWLAKNTTALAFGSNQTSKFFGFKQMEEKTIAGTQGVEFSADVLGFANISTALKKDDHIFVIGYITIESNLANVYNQILSTFKFLE